MTKAHAVLVRVRQGASDSEVKREVNEIEESLERKTESFRSILEALFQWKVLQR